MKYLVITALFAFIALANSSDIFPLNDAAQEKITKVAKECVQSTTVAQSVVDEMRNGKFPDDVKLKEYFFCSFKKMNWQDESGKFKPEEAKKDFKPDKVFQEVVTKCLEEVKADKGPQIAFDFFKCFCTNLPKGYKATLQ